ncbi:ABC transporter ATP-binding protein [Janthinobacterium aquaticum]|uniref:ABC transporter ATP-binding protein n=1 Tax=Janthinobacterium sp. FT58W TaxID=2654254 RepID=UPI00126439CA|nr:ABC transporter ATP-binding protein [Janthinobacterium sp. FT58W]KAB8043351.1 ATP-binding cassette domain-containing protein [Janthinobacterium sp. FT58W]
MSSDEIAIRVSNLSKRYEIYDTPRDRLKQFILPRTQRLSGRKPRQYFREFWALNDVSFEIRRGETVGVIGRNGSGKSTLLQMICGTLTPTSGSIETRGRIAALLELGSGFNPEFTGRENIYLNASVLGLTIEEIDARYDDIVAFADIGQFVEQPVKTYSSGMYLRLAFAVIAHVDADILVVDEALAVGDAVFTQKCMRFIRKFQENGTLIFVSHDTASVQNLCRSGIWLKHGRVEQLGTAKAVSEAYLQYTLQEIYGAESKLKSIGGQSDAAEVDDAPLAVASSYGAQASVQNNLSDANGWRTGDADIISVKLTRLSDNSDVVFEGDEPVRMTVRAKAYQPLERPILGFLVRDRLGQDLFGENTLHFTGLRPTPIAAGEVFEGIFEFRLPMLPNGQYAVMASVADGDLQNHIQHHWLHDALIVNISSSKIRYGLVGLPFTRAELEVIHE